MALDRPESLTTGGLLLGVVCAAVGLNLSVMGLGAQPPGVDETAAPAPIEDEVRQLQVDVPVPMAGSTSNATSSTDGPAPASTVPVPAPEPTPAPIQPVAAATSLTTAAPANAPTTAAPTTAAPSTTSLPTPTPTSASPPTTAGPSTEYLTYTFDGVAEIVIAHHDDETLEFWSATPEAGWAFMVEKNTARKVEVKFRRVSGGEGEAKFVISIDGGDVEVKKER